MKINNINIILGNGIALLGIREGGSILYFYEKQILQHFDNLSPTLKRIATFLKENPNVFANNSATKIAKIIGTSETSVIRFVYSIGYDSFTKLQRDLRDSIYDLKNSLINLSNTVQELEGTDPKNALEETILRDQINIRKTVENIDPVMFKKVVDTIAIAKEVVVLGSGASYGLAHWFSFMLNTVIGNSRLLNVYMDDFSFIGDLNKDSVLITFSFSRYMKQTIEITKELKERGVYVIGITDSDLSPIAQISDATFTTKMSHMSTIDSGPVITSLLNTIINQIIRDNPDQYLERRTHYEASYKHLFWKEGKIND